MEQHATNEIILLTLEILNEAVTFPMTLPGWRWHEMSPMYISCSAVRFWIIRFNKVQPLG